MTTSPSKAKADRKIKKRPVDVQAEWTGRHNYTLNSALILRDAYRLLTVVLGDFQIALEADSSQDPLVQLRERFVEDELIHLLIGTAVINRSQDDHMSGPREDANELSFVPVDHTCGTLRPDVSKKTSVPLTFREACNKIIHADHIIVQTEKEEDAAYDVLPTIVTLQGRQRSASWEAQLDIVDYVRATVKNFNDLR